MTGMDASAAQGRATAASKRASSHNGLGSTPYHTYYVEEEWRPVVGWEGWYSVSNLGRVRRDSRHQEVRRRHAGRVLSVRFHPRRRYAAIHLFRDGASLDRYLHVLVAEAFLGPCPKGKEANHRDGDRKNNAASNLEYMTHSQNIRHALRLGLRRRKYGQQHLALALEVGA